MICTNPGCPGDCAVPNRALVCTNSDCPEQGIRKRACHADVPAEGVRCGHCGQPCGPETD